MEGYVRKANFLTPLPGNNVVYSSPLRFPDGYAPSGAYDTVTKAYVDGEVVETVTALRALPKTGNTKAITRGYYAANDGGSGVYYYDAADIATADNGGTVIVATDGGRWKLQYSGTIGVKQWGAKGDGTTDDTAKFQAALAALGAAGGAVSVDFGRYRINTALTIPPNCTLRGPHAIVGTPFNNGSSPYGQVGGALLLNSAVTITMSGGSSLQGLLVYRYGMTFPAPDTTGWAGTAVTATNVDDICVKSCMFLGFAKALVTSGCKRMRYTDINIDCLGGVEISTCTGASYLSNIHCWPFATIAAGVLPSSYARSGIAYRFITNDDFGKVLNCYELAYAKGFSIEGCNSICFEACTANSYSGSTTVGWDITTSGGVGGANNLLLACKALSNVTGYHLNIPAGSVLRMTECDAWSNSTQAILIDSGDVIITGGSQLTNPIGVNVNSATSSVFVDRVRFYDTATCPIYIAQATTLVKVGENNDFGNYTGSIDAGSAALWTTPAINSAAALAVPPIGNFFIVNGTTGITSITGGWANRRITLKFTNSLTVTKNASIVLGQTMYTSSGDTLTVVYDGGSWIEVSRSTLFNEPTALDSADPLPLPSKGSLFIVNLNNNFGTISNGWAGRRITLEFTGTPTVIDGVNIKLAGNFVATASSTLNLIHDGTSWLELSRSNNAL